MRKFLLPSLSLVALCVFAAESPREPANTAMVGRYQLIAAQVHVGDRRGGADETHFMFKLDTVTGRAWYFYAGFGSNSQFRSEYWIPVQSVEEFMSGQKFLEGK